MVLAAGGRLGRFVYILDEVGESIHRGCYTKGAALLCMTCTQIVLVGLETYNWYEEEEIPPGGRHK